MQLTDLTPTVLRLLGVPEPTALVGSPVRALPGPAAATTPTDQSSTASAPSANSSRSAGTTASRARWGTATGFGRPVEPEVNST